MIELHTKRDSITYLVQIKQQSESVDKQMGFTGNAEFYVIGYYTGNSHLFLECKEMVYNKSYVLNRNRNALNALKFYNLLSLYKFKSIYPNAIQSGLDLPTDYEPTIYMVMYHIDLSNFSLKVSKL